MNKFFIQINSLFQNILKQMSDGRVSKWSDTLAAKRKAKLDWKMEKDAKEEKMRQEIDKEEARLQQIQRDQTIKRAKHILFERNEKVKFLRSQQMYSDVIEERENQMNEKLSLEKKKILEEEKWHQETMHKIKQQELKETEKAYAQTEKAKEICEVLKKQRMESETLRKNQLELQKYEDAELLKKIAFDDMKAEQKSFLDKLERKKKNKEHMAKMKEDAKRDEKVMTLKEEKERAERLHVIAEKERITQARAELEKSHFERKIENNGIIEKRAYEDLENRSKKELELFLRDQKRANNNVEEAQKRKAQEKEMQQQLIHESRQNQIKLKERQRLAQKEEALQIAIKMQEMNIVQQQQEMKKSRKQRQKNLEVRLFLEKQRAEIEKKKDQERKEQLAQAQRMKKSADLEDDQFKELALREIEIFRSQGKKYKNIAMLERAMNMKDVTLLPGVQ